MNRKIKLVWDFYGGDAEGTAKHHVIHLEQFMEREKLSYIKTGIESNEDFHCLAFITVNEKDVVVLRDSLRPNRAFIDKSL